MVVDLADLEQRASVIASAREDPPNYLVNAAAILEVIAARRRGRGDLPAPLHRQRRGALVPVPRHRWRPRRRRSDRQLLLAVGALGVHPRDRRLRRHEDRHPGRDPELRHRARTAQGQGQRHLARASPTRRCRRRSCARSRPCAGCRYEELSSNRTKLVPLARSAPPSEMAGVVLWLLSDAASYITGQTIYVDGGYIMSA